MKVLIFHGYLLRGTGSNIYTASLARALARAGHEVHVCCQDLDAGDLPWVSGVGRWPDPSGEIVIEGEPAAPGRITAHLPPIGRTLPVYVHDHYEGFEARVYPDLTDAEIETYIERNVAAIRSIADAAGGIDAAISNHLVMGPVICARVGVAFAAKIHGSALSYTVLPNRGRFIGWAREGVTAAQAILVGSDHIASELDRLFADPGLAARVRLAPPGVDTGLFVPIDAGGRRRALGELAGSLAGARDAGLGRNPSEAAAALSWFAESDGPRFLYVGKLIPQKGVALLIDAWPSVLKARPGARLLIAGFGEGEPDLRTRAEGLAGSIRFSGRLEHDEVAVVSGAADVQVVPSVHPEAFGMVVAEAAAAGAFPVCAGHSGLAEVGRVIAAAIGEPLGELVCFEPGDAGGLARSLAGLAASDPAVIAAATEKARRACAERWSWDTLAAGVLAAASGDLSQLARPGYGS